MLRHFPGFFYTEEVCPALFRLIIDFVYKKNKMNLATPMENNFFNKIANPVLSGLFRIAMVKQP